MNAVGLYGPSRGERVISNSRNYQRFSINFASFISMAFDSVGGGRRGVSRQNISEKP